MQPIYVRFAILAWLTVSVCLSSQSGAQDKPPALKSNTRLVVVDVVATDHNGQPVSGLTADDFAILEDRKPQKISAFSFQHPEATGSTR